MGQTVDQAVTRILHRLEGRTRLPLDRLNGAVTTTSETIVCEFGDRNIVNGTRLEIGYEILQVYDDSSAPSYSALRALDGGAAAGTLADNTLVKIEPWAYKQDVLETLEEVINDLPDSVYAVTTTTVSFTADTPYAELTGASGKDVLWARAERDPETASGEPYLSVPLNVVKNDASSTGWFVQIAQGMSYDTAQTVEVTYAHTFDTSTFISSTDLEDTVGLPESFLATVHYGAMARIASGEEYQRNQMQAAPQGRRAEEVQPGVWMEIAREWERKFESGVAREASRLRREYPITERA